MSRLFIENCTLIDGSGADPILNAGVLIQEGVIAQVGARHDFPSSVDALAFDADGAFLLPGLIDAHVHLTLGCGPDVSRQAADDSIGVAAIRAVANALAALRAGVTTLRDLGAKGGVVLDLVRAIDTGIISGPRIVASGAVIAMTGGHGHFIGREADGPDEVRKAVREQLKAGAGVIKVMATGGVLTPGIAAGAEQLTPAELAAAAEEAHKAGRLVASHAIGNAGIKNALRAGIDTIEHGKHLDDEAIELLLERHAFLIPTLSAGDALYTRGVSGGVPKWALDKSLADRDVQKVSLQKAIAAGVRIAAGTDAGTPFNPHGGLARELELLVEMGLTPMQAIVAGTQRSAEAIGLDSRIGTVEEGKVADLILVDRDPLADIAALQNVTTVFQAGRVVRGV